MPLYSLERLEQMNRRAILGAFPGQVVLKDTRAGLTPDAMIDLLDEGVPGWPT